MYERYEKRNLDEYRIKSNFAILFVFPLSGGNDTKRKNSKKQLTKFQLN